MLTLARKLDGIIDVIARRNIRAGEHIVIKLLDLRKSIARIGIDASLNYDVHRREVAERLGNGNVDNYIQQIKNSYQIFEQGAGI